MKKIGIVGSVFDKIFGVKIPYTSFFEQYGEVVILGPTVEVQDIDLLVLPGGLDVLSIRYNENPNTRNTRVDPFFEWFDKKILPLYIENHTPIIGLCRGFQTLNIHFGGTIIQNLRGHEKNTYSRTDLVHSVSILDSYLTNGSVILVDEGVNSIHHQGVKMDNLAKILVPVAVKSKENKENIVVTDIVEIFKHKTLPIWGLQYHPEEIYDENSNEIIKYLLCL
jgi:putative glutamine amidotransferase